MADPITFGAVAGGLEAARRVCGPTLDEIGLAMGRWTQDRLRNVGRVLDAAGAKLDVGAEGEVPARVAMAVLEEASWCEDGLMGEYLGGVLAASVVHSSSDDRGIGYASLLPRLSTFQVKCHFLVYESIRLHLRGTDAPLKVDQSVGQLFITHEAFADFLGVEEELQDIVVHALTGLAREGLIGAGWRAGRENRVRRPEAYADIWGASVSPSLAGIELFLWAHGLRSMSIRKYLQSDDSPFSSPRHPRLPATGIRLVNPMYPKRDF